MAHDFTLVYELGRDMGCRTMLCADRQTASGLLPVPLTPT